eukprot:CAMPEP_0167811358 /NCGR_PEP_ID=MMETSP0112_2-20121227/624_1 /TAXON_ID=91324 /ORGANISM="Lotharella globosa, Strain CCCM811" /LENGTH=40 /DNA_ID= /DNA_START= /DNA_END= /DNA_ORIENTATION=
MTSVGGDNSNNAPFVSTCDGHASVSVDERKVHRSMHPAVQ